MKYSSLNPLPAHSATSALHALLMAAVCASLLSFGAPTAQAQSEAQTAGIEVVRLQHRDAIRIKEAIAPFLHPDGDISSFDNNLIISTSRANLADLRELVTALDTPRRQLRVSVDFDFSPDRLSDDSGTRQDGSTRIVTISTEDLRRSTRQSIQVLEGETAFLSLSHVTRDTTVVATPSLFRLQGRSGIEQQERVALEQGLSISAELNNAGQQTADASARVTLEAINRRPDELDASTSVLQSGATTVDLPLDEWLPLNPPADIDSPFTAGSLWTEGALSAEGSLSAEDSDIIAIRIEVVD